MTTLRAAFVGGLLALSLLCGVAASRKPDAAPPPAPTICVRHYVQPGDTLLALAQRYGAQTDAEQVEWVRTAIRANGWAGRRSRLLVPSQVILAPIGVE